jgi:ribonucleotide reductase alpha subunit
MQEVTDEKLDSMHFHAWRSGLKTGMYYLRTKPATDAIKFTIDPELVKAEKAKNDLFDSIMRVKVSVQKGDASQAVVNIQIPMLERQLSAAEVHAARQRQEEENRRKEEEDALLTGSCVGGSCSG